MNEKDITKVLEYFTSNVTVHEKVTKESKIFIQGVLERRQREEEADTFDNSIEKLKGYNLISFLHFVLGEREDAIKYNDLALGVDDRNINALACRTFYHLKWSEFYKSSQICQKLKALKTGHELAMLSARAEVAYLFSKFGMKFYPEAEKMFEDVINESDVEFVSNMYKCSWYFSLAQTIRRQLNFHNAPTPLEPKQSEALYQRVINLFTEITHTSGDDVGRYRAKAFAELGLVLYFNRESNFPSVYSHDECMHNALDLYPDEPMVLERCGKYFRLTKKLEEAIKCFDWAIEKKETSYCFHHLALCYKIKAIEEEKEINTPVYSQTFNRSNTLATQLQSPVANVENWNWNWKESYQARNFQGWQNPSEVRNGRSLVRGGARGQGRGRGRGRNVRGSRATCNGRRYEPMSPEEKFHSKILKCPKKLDFIPPTKIGKLLELLDKAVHISHGNNTAALYDKGLIYRHSKQFSLAIQNFKLIFENKSSSDIQLANSYEQAALCLLEIAETEPLKNEECEFDAKECLKKAMEISGNMISKIPNLRRCWHSTPTLKMLLLRQAKTKENLKELASFYKLLNNYSAAIGFLKTVLNIEEDVVELQTVLEDILEANLKLKNINEAALLLAMIRCLPNKNELMNKSLHLKVSVMIGIQAWKQDDRELAKERFNAAIRFGSTPQADDLDLEYNNSFDLFILSSVNSEDKARQLQNIFTGFGLKATLNDDDVLPGHPKTRTEIMDRIQVSQYVVVYISADDEQEDLVDMKMYTDFIRKRFIVISEGGRAERDSLYSRYPVVAFTCEIMDENGNITNDFFDWFEGFFIQLATD